MQNGPTTAPADAQLPPAPPEGAGAVPRVLSLTLVKTGDGQPGREVPLEPAPATTEPPLAPTPVERLTAIREDSSPPPVALPESGPAADAEPPQFDAATSAVAAGQLLLRRELAQWRSCRAAVLEGTDREALHRLRVSGRRLIAALRILERAPLRGALALRRKLTALVRSCGVARDLDVQLGELETLAQETASHDLLPLLADLTRQREREQRRLRRGLVAARAQRVFIELDTLAVLVPQRPAARPLATVAEDLLKRRQRQLQRAARRVARQSSAEHCHALRLETKKLRYLCEPFATLYGEPLRRYLVRLQQLQALLGRINDCHHAISTLEGQVRRAGGDLPATALFAMGRAAEQQQARLLASTGRLRAACRRANGRRWRRLRSRAGKLSQAVHGASDAGTG
jgi:CHAD domain-containing protein